ncbi:MAG: N-acetylmuramoyl-L-alanine amidase-like domain-containing protein [Bacteroidota bacterium]
MISPVSPACSPGKHLLQKPASIDTPLADERNRGVQSKTYFLLFLILCCGHPARAQDQKLCGRIFSFATSNKLIEKPIGEVVALIGEQFLGTPYEPNTLEQPGEERLVVNLRAFDCVTLVENVLALARCVKKDRLSFNAFGQELQKLRYRNGRVTGYASRLHYFIDWISDNQKKGIVEDVTQRLAGKPYRKAFNFMSKHRKLYRQLAIDSTFSQIEATEEALSNRSWLFVPKSKIIGSHSAIQTPQSEIRSGDIIAFTTEREGLDIAHTAIALRLDDGSLHCLHAPDAKGKVRITDETLSEYIQKHTSFTGIIVARPVALRGTN